MNKLTEQIVKVLKEKGFKEDNQIWSSSKKVQGPSTKFVINGQEVIQPGPEIELDIEIEWIEGGTIQTAGKEDIEEFNQIIFRIKQNNVEKYLEECLYLDEIELFNKILNYLNF